MELGENILDKKLRKHLSFFFSTKQNKQKTYSESQQSRHRNRWQYYS